MRNFTFRFVLATALVTTFLVTAPTVFAQDQRVSATLVERERKVKQLLHKVGPAVVAVTDDDGWGSGTIVSGDGLVLTAGHVTMKAESGWVTIVLPNGERVRARTLGRNLKTDAGLLKLESDRYKGRPWPHVELGSTAGLKRGDWTVSLGHPGGLIDAEITARPAPVRMGRVLSIGGRTVVTDGTIIVGDSGGPLFDLDGRLIGVHSMIGSDITNNRHVLVDVVRRDWARLEDGDTWGTLGEFDTGLVSSLLFGTELIWDDYEARVRKVVPGSPAARAGIRSRDKLVGIDGQAIADPLELSLVLGERHPGDRITAEVQRGNETLKVNVTLGPYPRQTKESKVPVRRKPGRYEKAGEFALAEFRPVVARSPGVTVEFVETVADENGKTRELKLALGTVVSADGYIATKYSEVDEARNLVCRLDTGEELAAKVVAYEREFDIALVKIESQRLKPVVWQEQPVELGQIVVSPSRSGAPVASGVISVRTRRLADRGFLGVSSTVEGRRRRGARVDQLVPDGAAERAGIRQGDLIIQINSRVISDFDDLKRRIETFKALDKIVVKVERPTGPRSAEIMDVEVILSVRFVPEQWRTGFERKNLLGPSLSAHASGFPLALQHDTVLQANQCGGPLLNIEGQAVGINISRAGRVMSYAIPASEAKKLVRTLIANAEAAE